MKKRKILALFTAFSLAATMFGTVPASADTITGDGTGEKTGTMTITLTITGELSNDNVTLSADSFTYNGSTQKPTVTVKHQRGSGTEVTLTEDTDYTVAITKDGTAVTEPTDVGTYTVTVTGKGVYSGTGSKTFEITKSTPAAPPAPEMASATKNSITLAEVTGCEYSKDGTTYQDSPTFTGLLPSTEYTFYQRKKLTTNTNASEASSEKFSTEADTYALKITLTIKEMTVAAENVSAEYDGKAHGITVNVTEPTSGYTVKYGTTEGTYDLDESPAITNVADSPLTVYYQVTADNYKTKTGSATVKLTKASQSKPVLTSTNETIDGKADGTITGLTKAMEISTASATSGFEPVTDTSGTGYAAGTYYVRYAEGENYNASDAASVIINTGSKITVQFDADEGTPEPDSQEFTYNQTVSKPETDPEKTGYTFKFWSADGTAEYDFTAPLTANITLTAIYQANSYTITFDTDGGTAIAPIKQDYGTAVTAPAEPTKEGYAFAGWDKKIPATMPAEDITIKAKWTVKKYVLTFIGLGFTAEYNLEYNEETADYIPITYSAEGYTIIGWDQEIPARMPDHDVTITELYKVNQYTVTFDTDGGSSVDPITVDYGAEVKAPTAPTKAGYTFAGWDPALPATMPAENITVKAKWTTDDSGTTAYVSTPVTAPASVPASSVDSAAEYKITGEETEDIHSSKLEWGSVPNASDYSLHIKVNGKYVFVQELGSSTSVDVVLSESGKYYVSTGGNYTVYEYDQEKESFVKTGTLKADKIEKVAKANNVTESFMIKYKKNGKESSEKDSLKVSVKVYYKPAVKVTAEKGSVTIKWNKVPDAEKYRVYKYVNGKLKLMTETSNRAVKIKNTKAGKTYTYAVKAYVNGEWTKLYESDLVSVKAK